MAIISGAEHMPMDEADSLLGASEVITEIEGLTESKEHYHAADHHQSSELERIRLEIRKLKKEEDRLLGERAQDRQEHENHGLARSRRLASLLEDPNIHIHPLLKHVAEAQMVDAQSGVEAFWQLDTTQTMMTLAKDLIGLDEMLKGAEKSLPAVVIGNNSVPGMSHSELLVSYGWTIPGEGLVPRTDPTVVRSRMNPAFKVPSTQPVIIVPTTNDPKVIMAPSYNSHFVGPIEGHSVLIDENGRKTIAKNHPAEAAPVVDDLVVPLPVGAKSLRDRSQVLFTYDSPDAELSLEAIIAAHGFSGRSGEATAFIGPDAVRGGLTDLYANSYRLGQRPGVVKALARTVLGNFNLSIAPKRFERPDQSVEIG